MNWITTLLNKIYNWFKSKFIQELPESVQSTIEDTKSLTLFFYGAIKDYTIKNITLHIGDEDRFISEFSNDKDNATKIVITNLDIDEITAELDVVCNDGSDCIHLSGVVFYGYNFFVEGAEIRYKITDSGLGLCAISFNVGVASETEQVITSKKCIRPEL